MKRITAVIPARGGSKGIPRKNLADLGGRPLVGWAIEVARRCDLVSRVVVSTEDPEIARVALDLGASVPFLRPTELAADETPDWPVFVHVVQRLAELDGQQSETIVWLRPTVPFRTAEDIVACVQKLHASGASAVRSVCRVTQHPYWTVRLEGDRLRSFLDPALTEGMYQRQRLPPAYIPNGAVDVFAVAPILELGGLFIGDVRAIVMPEERSLDIDSEADLARARALLNAGVAGR